MSKMILLVDDNPDDVDLALRAFKKHELGHEIHVAEDGPDALAFLLGSGEDGQPRALPRFVLLDLKLRKVDGFEVLERIRSHERTRLLPVIILSSSTEEADVRRSYQLGANSYVRKPVSFVEFVEATRQLSSYWLTLNHPPPAPAPAPASSESPP